MRDRLIYLFAVVPILACLLYPSASEGQEYELVLSWPEEVLGLRSPVGELWSVDSWEEITTLVGHTAEILSVSFSSDGKTLASGSVDGAMLIWNLAQVIETSRSRRHKNPSDNAEDKTRKGE